MRKHGKISVTKYDKRFFIDKGDYLLVPLGAEAKQGFAKVDKEFKHLEEYKWSINNSGYPQSNTGSGQMLIHQMVMGKRDGFVIDHISRDKLDNRKANLQFVAHYMNLHNRPKQTNNVTGYKNVVRFGTGYRADISVKGKRHFTNRRKTPFEAYKDAVILRQKLGLPI